MLRLRLISHFQPRDPITLQHFRKWRRRLSDRPLGRRCLRLSPQSSALKATLYSVSLLGNQKEGKHAETFQL